MTPPWASRPTVHRISVDTSLTIIKFPALHAAHTSLVLRDRLRLRPRSVGASPVNQHPASATLSAYSGSAAHISKPLGSSDQAATRRNRLSRDSAWGSKQANIVALRTTSDSLQPLGAS